MRYAVPGRMRIMMNEYVVLLTLNGLALFGGIVAYLSLKRLEKRSGRKKSD